MSGEEFEWFVGEIFRRRGWAVEETGRQDAHDGNIDLRVAKDGQRRIVQCKRWDRKWVGVNEVRAFAGTVAREKLPQSAGIFVTLSDFTGQAREEAKRLGLTLVDNRTLFALVEKVRRPEHCENCHESMRLDRTPDGWEFTCQTAGCGTVRSISDDAGRVVDLLTSGRPEVGYPDTM